MEESQIIKNKRKRILKIKNQHPRIVSKSTGIVTLCRDCYCYLGTTEKTVVALNPHAE
ncbi:MAG: hypothetical protein ACD_7C00074G0003 [uncultured bacterium]|nr:MAG: hypothetical protein ACD_7C00074G0003 [uncultured bacterium]